MPLNNNDRGCPQTVHWCSWTPHLSRQLNSLWEARQHSLP